MLLSIILILGIGVACLCSALGLSTSTAGQGSQNGGNSGAGGTPGARRFGGTLPAAADSAAEGTTFPAVAAALLVPLTRCGLTQLAEGTTFPGGGQGGFARPGSPTATFPPLPTATATPSGDAFHGRPAWSACFRPAIRQ